MVRQMQPDWKLQDYMHHKVAELGLESKAHVAIRRVESTVWDELCPGLGSARWACECTLLDGNVDPEIILPIKSFAERLRNQFDFVVTAD